MTNDAEDLVRRLWQCVWIDGDLEALADILADPYVRHTRDGTETTTIAAYSRHIASVWEAFRGTEVRFDQLAAVGDHVHARLTLTGVNIALGDEVTLTWLTEYRIADGRIAESWGLYQPDLDW